MRPFALPEVDPAKPRGNHAGAGIRTLLVGALCLCIGFGLGGLWHSRRAQRSGVDTQGEAPGQNVGAPSAPPATAPPATAPSPTAPPVTAPPATAVVPVDPATLAEVKRQIPNFASVSLEEGTRILRESAFNDFKAAMREMESRVTEAQQRVARAQDANAEAEKQAALRELQRLQAEQAAKLRDISVRSSAQVDAFRQLKESVR